MRTICFSSDYGLVDEFAGVCRAVIARIAPAVPVIDITHGIARQDVHAGAVMLRNVLPFTPDTAVHLAVVDPGVGGERRPLALRSVDGRLFVGPDNGLLMLAVDEAGGVAEGVALTNCELWLKPASRTFHGRDIFAPVAARLAAGLDLDEAGDRVDSGGLVRLSLSAPAWQDDSVAAVVVQVDVFGNAALSLEGGCLVQLPAALEVEHAGRSMRAHIGATFTDVREGDLVVYSDSNGQAAIAVNGGSAAGELGLLPGSAVILRPQRG